jgi:hypothetical protein
MTRIVTSTYRYKRPPRKRKAVALEAPAIVRKRGRVDAVAPPDRVEEPAPRNDNHQEGPKSRILQAAKPKGRRKAWVDDGQETPPEIKALIKRMMLGRGPGST